MHRSVVKRLFSIDELPHGGEEALSSVDSCHEQDEEEILIAFHVFSDQFSE